MHGEKVKKLLKERGLKQKELAEVLGLPSSSVSMWVNATYPPLDFIEKVCTYLRIPLWQFFVEDYSELEKSLPPYITQDDAEALRVLNTNVSADNRILAKEMFANVLELALRASGQHV